MPSVHDLSAAIGELAKSALTILVLAVVAYIVLRISRRFVTRILIRRLETTDDDPDTRAITIAETQKRVETISELADWVLRLVIVTFAVLAVLVALGMTSVVLILAAVLAGMAIVAQDVIRDYVGGAIIVLENQFGIGDWVTIAGATGEVESLSLRRTNLRNDVGDLVTVPNGEIRVAINQTRIWARISFEVGIVDPARVEDARRVIDAAGTAFAADPAIEHSVLEAPRMVRVSGVDPSGVRLLVRGRVRASERWRLNGEFRQRVVAALTEGGIELVTMQRVRIADPTVPAGTTDA
jgi:moderate conductance mechanosensitive channel